MNKMNKQICYELLVELKEKLLNSFVSKIIVLDNGVALSTSFLKQEHLFLSLDHNNPGLAICSNLIDIPTKSGKLNEILKQKIKNNKISNIEEVNNDKIFKFSFDFYDVFNTKHQYFLIFEAIPHHPNLILTDENNTVIYAYYNSDLNSTRMLLVKGEYTLPPYHELKQSNYTYPQYKNDLSKQLDEQLQKRRLSAYLPLIKYLEKEIKKCQRKVTVLNKEIDDNNAYYLYQQQANYLLTYMHSPELLKEYLETNDVDYEDNLSISENANKLFKKYKKMKATVAHDKDELIKNDQRTNELKVDLKTVNSLDIEAINKLADRYPKFIKRQKITINPKYPFYVEIDGVKYGYGRNAMQNDYLTFKLASKNHYFFHIKDYHGAHVILMKDKPNDEEILIASQIAIYASKKDIGEVNYCPVSQIKKGGNAGQVILSSYKSINVKYIEDKIKNALKNSRRLLS